jgi:hypothetical protein
LGGSVEALVPERVVAALARKRISRP